MTARAALSFSSDLEFANEAELAKRMGCQRQYWLRATLKELVDNALDASEEAGIETPSILVAVEDNKLTVADNGPGIAPELVERLCVRSERTSTREAYAAPDRGAQGNALQVLMALPFGFGLEEAGLTITSRGIEHTIALRVNRLEQRVDLERTTREVAAKPGTTVAIEWPEEIDLAGAERLINEHAWLNPHAVFRLEAGAISNWEATTGGTKWTPGLRVPAHWYDLDRFAHRVLLEIKRDPEITVAQFLTTFKGLTSSTKRSEVATAADLAYQPLAALLDQSGTDLDRARTSRLLNAMQGASRPPKHAVLGAVGKESFEDWALNRGSADHGELKFLAYTTLDGVVTGTDIPYRWEIGFCHLPGASERQVLIGQNFSPAISPLEMMNALLRYPPWQLGAGERIALFLHRITPARQTLDYGKSRLALGYGEIHQVEEALERIAKPWMKYRDKQNKGKKPTLPDQPKPERLTFKEAVFRAMAEAYEVASSGSKYPIISQQVFYKARPKILELTGKTELKDKERNRFCYTLLPLFVQEHRELTRNWRIIYKPWGDLIEPHTRQKIGLGTTEVAHYRARWTNGLALGDTDFDMPEWKVETHGPHHRYGAVVIVEKGGIADVLRQADVDDRNDVAIIGNQGQSVEAELVLADALGRVDVPIFLLTDFDRQGFTIAENLRTGTWRHRYQNRVQAIHVGLRLDQIIGLCGLASEVPGGLEDEPIGKNTLEHVGDDRLRECGATAEEIDLLRTRRVELNALTTEQLVALVESALAEHGIAKVIPDAAHLEAAWRAAKAHAEIAEAVEEANKQAERWQDEPAPGDLEERVRKRLEQKPEMSWDAVLREIAEEAAP
jgi:Histidine kinase-, DNA gyrase B-, and HSP90-like ATPase